MTSGSEVKLVIPSEIRLVDLVHQASERAAEVAGFEDDEALDVGLAVREAVINAIRHGNREDPRLAVTIRLRPAPGRLIASIRDRGNGFKPEETPDPTDPQNLLRTSGRGLLLMRAFVDEVRFKTPKSGGTEVILIKRRPPEGTSESPDDRATETEERE